MLQLIPGSSDNVSTESYALDQKKGSWSPTPAHLRTRSFPTPYAQAEMMSHVLGMLSVDPGARQPQPEAENTYLQQSFERWRLLLLALVLGEVALENIDLRRPEVDNFGAMLADLRPECRFLGLLRDVRRRGPEGRGLLVGAADPLCLFWCAPRVHREHYWNDLKTRIDASADRAAAMALLAEWRGWFERNGLWSPGHEESPPWMKALQVLLGDAPAQPAGLATDARMVGPVRLAVVPRTGNDPREVVAYLPARHPEWAARFAELMFFQPVRREAGSVDLVDPNGRAVVTVRMAPREAAQATSTTRADAGGDTASVAGFELLSGVGRIEPHANAARAPGQSHWLEDHPNAPGYRSLVLNPLLAAAARSHRKASIADGDVQAFPILYPDTVRLVVAQASEAMADGHRIQLSPQVTQRIPAGVPAPQAGASMQRWSPGDPLPRVVAVPGADGALHAGLVEHFGPEARKVDVGELRALGLSLWLCFIGEAELRPDGHRVVWTANEGRDLFGRTVSGGAERSLEVLRDAMQAVHADAERERARGRLATLQRFAASWRVMGEGEPERPEVQCARLGRVAAEHFVAWVLAGSGLVLGPFGLRAGAAPDQYALSGAYRLPLLVDPLLREV